MNAPSSGSCAARVGKRSTCTVQRSTVGGKGLDAGRLRHLAGTDAPSAHPEVGWLAVDHRPDPLQVGQPTSLGDIVGVGDVAPRHRAFAADIASLRHGSLLQAPAVGVGIDTTRRNEKQDRCPGSRRYLMMFITRLLGLRGPEYVRNSCRISIRCCTKSEQFCRCLIARQLRRAQHVSIEQAGGTNSGRKVIL